MKLLLGWIALLLVCAASASASVEVGECAPQKPGAYSDTACTVSGAKANHVWRELPPGTLVTDGHEGVGDEPARIGPIRCGASNDYVTFTSFTTDTERIRLWQCEVTATKTPCAEVLTDQMAGVVGEEAGFATNTYSAEHIATFTCGLTEYVLAGSFTGRYESRKVGDETGFALNTAISKAYLHVGPGDGPQSLTLNGEPVEISEMVGEMRFGGPVPAPPNKHVVFRSV